MARLSAFERKCARQARERTEEKRQRRLAVDVDGVEERLSIGYTAREQFEAFHARKQRWALIVAHRRAGKTVACVMDLIDSAIRCKLQRPRFAYVAPLYRQAKQVAWDYLRQYARKVPGTLIYESELKVDFINGGQVRLYGADNPDALRGMYLDGVILDEAADMSPRVYSEVLRPALSDRQGWAVWIGTPRGMNDFYDLVFGTKGGWVGAKDDPEWFFRMLKASETKLIPKDELDSAAKQMSPEQYAQEYECSFSAAILGAYYGREMELAESEGRITAGIYDPSLGVNTAWDLGHSDATAIWFYQQSDLSIRVIDFYQASNRGLDHYVSILQDKASRPGNEHGYVYANHFLPHDVEVKILGMDRTRLGQLRQWGLQNLHVVPKLSIDEGIAAVRKIFPRCYFDREKCMDGLKALRQYRREWDDIRKTFYERPYHDWASDPADAFRYLAVGMFEPLSLRGINAMPRRNTGWIY